MLIFRKILIGVVDIPTTGMVFSTTVASS